MAQGIENLHIVAGFQTGTVIIFDSGRHVAATKSCRRQINRERYLERHEYYNARGPAFRPGLRIPPLFLHPSYVVIDYRLHRLPPPPRGHQWVQVGPDYVLVVIGTGLIVQIVLGF